MAERRIVPDNSVMIPAFFPETLPYRGNDFDLSARARPIAESIRLAEVVAFAPDALFQEFLDVAYRKARPRSGGSSIGFDELEQQFIAFAKLDITTVPAPELAATALDLVRNAEISPADSWYVACAIHTDAEIWVSHEHSDGLIEKAKKVHRAVHTLTAERF
ncbi:MAG: type II toxin-antitoxin system VapC family toxin [Tepidisphaeraceae bacterium]